MIESKRLGIHIGRKMKWFDRNMRSLNAPLEQRPEILQPVRVNDLIPNVGFGMVNEFMREHRIKTAIPGQRISVEGRSRFNMPKDDRMQGRTPAIRNDFRPNGAVLFAAVTFKQTHNRSLCADAMRQYNFLALGNVPVLRLATDVSFIRFNDAGQLLVERSNM